MTEETGRQTEGHTDGVPFCLTDRLTVCLSCLSVCLTDGLSVFPVRLSDRLTFCLSDRLYGLYVCLYVCPSNDLTGGKGIHSDSKQGERDRETEREREIDRERD